MSPEQEVYIELLEQLISTDVDSPEYDGLLDKMDGLWYKMSNDQAEEIDDMLRIFLVD